MSNSSEYDERRCKILRIEPELLMLIGSGKFEVIANPLPDDAELVDAFDDGSQFCMVLRSKSFASIPLGECYPSIEPPTIRRVA